MFFSPLCSLFRLCPSDIDEYVKYEHHSLNLLNQVVHEDMKVESKYYGNIIVLNKWLDKYAKIIYVEQNGS